MNVFPRSRTLTGRLALPVVALLFFLPALLSAQTVPVSTSGLVGITTGVPPTYTGQYVLQQTEYGFFWLDTSAPSAGHVQAVSKCVGGFPTSDTGIYVLGDCNSITNISASGTLSVVRMTSGQCGAQRIGCSGLRSDGHWRFTFGLGTWDYRGDLGEIPDSTQTADPLGRTWQIRPTDSTYRNFAWTVIGGGVPPTATSTPTPAFTPTPTPTPTPGPGFKATNLSSQLRGDSVNYYGDKWQLQDISNPSPTTRTDWDFNYAGVFVPDEGGTPDVEGTVTGYFPCDPSGTTQGNFHTGNLCRQSIGQTVQPSTASYQFALLSSVSPLPLPSGTLQVVCPQAGIVGYTGFTGTCAKSGGTLTVVRGGNADASPSLGNLQEASFDWVFNPGPSQFPASGKIVPVPTGVVVTSFALTVTLPGGYTSTASGSVTVVDSTPSLGIFLDAEATQSPFVFGGVYQLAAGTTYYLKDVEAVPPPSEQFFLTIGSAGTLLGSATGSNTLAWTPLSACTTGCSVKVTVGTISDSKPVSISAAGPLPTSTPAPSPTPAPGGLSVVVTGPSSGSRGVGLSFTANPSGGTPPYTYAWNCAFVPIFPSFSPGAQSTTCTYAAAGTYTVAAKVTDAVGASATSPGNSVTILGLPAPSISYSVSGPTVSGNLSGGYSASNGSPVTFTANETNAASWAWDFGDGTSATTRTAVKTYSAGGAYSVHLTVTGDETNKSGASSTTIPLTITGPPPPSTAYTVSGATQTGTDTYTAEAGRTITFTASATQASAFSWDFGDETKSGKSVTKSFSPAGSRTVRLTVTGDGTNTVGTASVSIAMTITPPTFRAVIVPGAAHLDDGTTTWGTDVSITNGGAAAMNIGFAFVAYSDSAASSLDLTQLTYQSPVALAPGTSYSISDVVAVLNGGLNKGTLVIKYAPGTRAPLVSARVYFRPKVNPGNISYGSGIPAYEVDGSGGVSPQGFVSAALSAPPGGLGTESAEAVLDVALTVNMTGSGSGTVTSDPGGINCPTTCTATFPVGTSVSLTGSASPGSDFYGFNGCDPAPLGLCPVVMSVSKSVTARFDALGPTPTPTPGPTSFTLTVNKAGAGTGTVSSTPSGISCGATCNASFPQGTAVTLTATPDAGFSFSGWGGACSGTGTCSLTMSGAQSVTATFAVIPATPPPSGDQYLIGLLSDSRYRFVVTLFNAGGTQGNFELRATDDQGSQVVILDASGSPVAFRRFNNLAPYQQVYLRDSDLFPPDSSGKHYVLKATATKGTLLAFGTTLDRKTLDLVQISDDSQASPAEDGIVSYWVAGVSRYDTAYGAHWRTDLRIFNRGSRARNLSFQYSFTADGVTEHVAQVANLTIPAGRLLGADDIVAVLSAMDPRVDLSGSSAGILRIFYPEDDESATRPLIIGSRNYNDDPTGTAGSQLSVYTGAQAGGASQDLFLPGVEDSDRYASRIGVFAMDPGPVTGRIVVVAPDGSEVGSAGFSLGGSSPHYGQIALTDPNLHFANPGKPVSVRFEQLSGGRVGAYAFTVDKVTLDTNFIQALPQN